MKGRMLAVLLALAVMAYAGIALAMDMPGVTPEVSGGGLGSMDAHASTKTAGSGHGSMDEQASAEAINGAHGAMEMHSMTPVDRLTLALDPMYPVGAQVVIETDHMAGTMGARGVVSGAFDTTLYAVDYTASDGTEVKSHRWVVSEEIVGGADKTFEVGDTVTLGQGHMESLGGAGLSAVIVQVVDGPAYMVDYDPTDGSARVVNHQWIAEFELESADSAS